MTPLEFEMEKLKTISFEMLELVKDQVMLVKQVLVAEDTQLCSEIMRKEKRVNAYELLIDRECEEFLAMQQPVASDLRFVIAVLKISGSLERIGDHAYRISTFVFDDLMKLTPEMVELASMKIIFDELEEMLSNVSEALETGDSQLAKKVFKQDKVLDKVNKNLHKLLGAHLHAHMDDLNNYFLLSKTISKLERMGDLIKNIGEEIIFYHDSKVVKHKKKNKRIEKKLGQSDAQK